MLILVFVVENVYDESNTCVGLVYRIVWSLGCEGLSRPTGPEETSTAHCRCVDPHRVWKVNMQHVEVSLIYQLRGYGMTKKK